MHMDSHASEMGRMRMHKCGELHEGHSIAWLVICFSGHSNSVAIHSNHGLHLHAAIAIV
jgi:hypothetical protein